MHLSVLIAKQKFYISSATAWPDVIHQMMLSSKDEVVNILELKKILKM